MLNFKTSKFCIFVSLLAICVLQLCGCVSVPTQEALPTYNLGGRTYFSLNSICRVKDLGCDFDTYTRRILSRHGMITDGASYGDIQGLFMGSLPQDVSLYQEYHALFVQLAKTFCKTKPNCAECPLEEAWPTSSGK